MTKIHEMRFVDQFTIRTKIISSIDFPLLMGSGSKYVGYFDPCNPLDVLSGQDGDLHIAVKVTFDL
jgi:hypothetical protein